MSLANDIKTESTSELHETFLTYTKLFEYGVDVENPEYATLLDDIATITNELRSRL